MNRIEIVGTVAVVLVACQWAGGMDYKKNTIVAGGITNSSTFL